MFVTAAAHAAPAQSRTCPPRLYNRNALRELKLHHWEIASAGEGDALAFALAPCLSSPDPEFRDQLAFDGLQTLMRDRALSDETMLTLAGRWEETLQRADPAGFSRPFAALSLAEVARADRKKPFLSPERRHQLVLLAAAYMRSVGDYRGFDDNQGWRHGVAHGADFIMQLSLNDAVRRPDLEILRDAVAVQIAPLNHFYIYGEPERLAVPIVLIAQRGAFSSEQWASWLENIASPKPLSSWDRAYGRNRDLARLHNIRSFLQALYIAARLDEEPQDDVLLAPLERLVAKFE